MFFRKIQGNDLLISIYFFVKLWKGQERSLCKLLTQSITFLYIVVECKIECSEKMKSKCQ